METPVLKRRLNPFLLASTVLVLSLLAGLSVMYQGQLSDILQEKKDLNSTLDEKNARISTLEGRISNLTNETAQLETDLQDYVSRTENLEGTVDSLNEQINNLEDDKEELNLEIEELEKQNKDLDSQVVELNGTLQWICEDSDNNLTEDSEESCESRGFDP